MAPFPISHHPPPTTATLYRSRDGMASVTHYSPSEPGSRSGPNVNRRAPRSKQGCLTCRSVSKAFLSSLTDANVCRRRKVRCNEQKPRCSHCERLNLQCTWRPVTGINQMPRKSSENGNAGQAGINPESENLSISPGNAVLDDSRPATVDDSFNDMFDYASFMWEHELQSGNMKPTRWRDLGFTDMDVLVQRGEVVSN